jgi:cobalt/nickel transport system permease protein
MHIPDGFVDIPTAAATGAVALGTVAYAVHKTKNELGERTVPLLGVSAAFIFAAQMLNFPVAGGTSGHFLGAMFAVALLGVWSAPIVMSVVLVVQALGMADGGITALGANVLNMGLVAVFVGFGIFVGLKKILPRTVPGYLVSVAVASWTSVVVASAAASAELAVSGTIPIRVALPAMVSVHMVIAIGEALITTALVAAVLATRPDLVKTLDLPAATVRRATGKPAARMSGRARFWSFVAGALIVAIALAVFVSPFASSSPDGLERVAADQNFEAAAADEPTWDFSPLGDYQLPGIGSERVATAIAGLFGTVALFALVILAGRALGGRRMTPAAEPAGAEDKIHDLPPPGSPSRPK